MTVTVLRGLLARLVALGETDTPEATRLLATELLSVEHELSRTPAGVAALANARRAVHLETGASRQRPNAARRPR